MPTDPCLATLVRRDWLDAGPLGHLVVPYIGALRGQRYGERTIRGYVGCLAHFCHWMACDAIAWSAPEAVSLIERFFARSPVDLCLSSSLLWLGREFGGSAAPPPEAVAGQSARIGAHRSSYG